ncbi:hypothetical protein F53441_7456 [Fusarium austroafricanum]|uniref:Uncharacterized protein n=1 Tax=Fusarium austroafricanum TaxID=2364996 RepID=A0A8H4P5U5_9HYPO|nr:hypothetical protein F53441_7456 [Fusarium austroafricanum]
MNTKTFFTALLGLPSTATAFEFIGPKTEELDLSKNITITWKTGNASELKRWPEFDLEWYSKPDELHGFGSSIQEKVNASDGEYTFSPSSNTRSTLDPFTNALASNKSFSFVAVFIDGGSKDPDTANYTNIKSQKYKVMGLNKRSAGAAVVPKWGAFVGGLVVAGVMTL